MTTTTAPALTFGRATRDGYKTHVSIYKDGRYVGVIGWCPGANRLHRRGLYVPPADMGLYRVFLFDRGMSACAVTMTLAQAKREAARLA